jgi:hypothetical protein
LNLEPRTLNTGSHEQAGSKFEVRGSRFTFLHPGLSSLGTSRPHPCP